MFCFARVYTVSQELSSSDKALLEEEGVSLPEYYRRKRKSTNVHSDVVSGLGSSKSCRTTGSDKNWEEVKQYLDPNPQLKGLDKGRYATKVSWNFRHCPDKRGTL